MTDYIIVELNLQPLSLPQTESSSPLITHQSDALSFRQDQPLP